MKDKVTITIETADGWAYIENVDLSEKVGVFLSRVEASLGRSKDSIKCYYDSLLLTPTLSWYTVGYSPAIPITVITPSAGIEPTKGLPYRDEYLSMDDIVRGVMSRIKEENPPITKSDLLVQAGKRSQFILMQDSFELGYSSQ